MWLYSFGGHGPILKPLISGLLNELRRRASGHQKEGIGTQTGPLGLAQLNSEWPCQSGVQHLSDTINGIIMMGEGKKI